MQKRVDAPNVESGTKRISALIEVVYSRSLKKQVTGIPGVVCTLVRVIYPAVSCSTGTLIT